MKKLFATALTCTMLFSLAACNSRKPEQTAPESSEAVVQVTETTEAEETTTVSETAETTAPSETSEEVTTETMAAAVGNKKDYLKDKVVKFKIKEDYNKKKKKWNYTTLEFHFPVLQIKSSYADSINKTMDKMIKKYQKDFKDKEDIGEYGTEYIAYLTKDGIMSIVFINTYPNDQIECKVYNIDVITGEKVDNARIAQIAGVSNIRKSAMNALQARYNKQKLFKVKNYKVVKKKGQKKNEDDKAVEKSFNTKHLNDKMKIGLTNEGKIFFVSGYFDGCCEDNDTVYDANGNDLYTKKNKNLVRAKY
ncbi:MAG: hypothetical protein IJ819_05430 [Clostridiales bacterium]|nr:hypothetical protein [Clostridiales bacterium]